jgi:glycosyltransferase involved in cell wall biosynthesis
VFHEGGASFGAEADPGISRAYAILTERYPDYTLRIAQFVEDSDTAPFRFAVTMALFRTSPLPVILVISHDLDGGVRRHVQDIIERDKGRVNYLVLEPASRGLALSIPALPGHPKLILAAERWRDVAAVARSAGVARVHIHHLMGLDLDVRALIHDLGFGFDVTVHDYFAICPQVTLLPWSAGSYCGEPGPAGCDQCIANRPSHGATDIVSWRLRWAWQFREAEQVFVPSLDALNRLRRYGLGRNASLAPHEAIRPGPWPAPSLTRPGKRLRVAVLGMLANHKGAHVVASVAMAAEAESLEIQVIGATEAAFPKAARKRMTINGPYREGELTALLASYRPHVIWFPAPWPETYSFTLSAAIEAGLPIVASHIGAFPERINGRPFTWLVPPSLDPAVWLTVFENVAAALRARPSKKTPVPMRLDIRDQDVALSAVLTEPRRDKTNSLVDLRREGTKAVVAIPETFDDGSYTPCAYIRLLLPLDHPTSGGELTTTLADVNEALRYRADIIVTQRHAVPSISAAEKLAAHAKRTGATLIYDLDDDLLTVPSDHPDAAELLSWTPVVERMIRLADRVRVSTEPLARRIGNPARAVEIAGNALDERIWIARERNDPYGPVKILCMGTSTHDADFSLIRPALTEIHRQFGDQIQFDLIGFVSGGDLPDWIRHLAPSPHGGRSYPGFVNWLMRMGPWDVGLAPLADTAFNACKSSLKTLDYAALGVATLASDVVAYRGSLADGPGGVLVSNTGAGWYEALSRMIRDTAWRRELAAGGFRALRARGTLATAGIGWNEAPSYEGLPAPPPAPGLRPSGKRRRGSR